MFTERARRVVRMAGQEAQRYNHERIATHHILIQLFAERNGIAATALRSAGITEQALRLTASRLQPSGENMVVNHHLPHTPAAIAIVDSAIKKAEALHNNEAGTGHLLLGLLNDKDNNAYRILASMKIDIDLIRETVISLLRKTNPQDQRQILSAQIEQHMDAIKALITQYLDTR